MIGAIPSQEEIMLVEYGALERRIQNDSRVAYGLATALIAFATAILAAIAGLFLTRILDKTNVFIIVFLLGNAAIIALYVGHCILKRFRETGDMRIARAIQIEDRLNIFSFRLFPPWNNLPNDYLWRFGETVSFLKWDGSNVDQRILLESIGSIQLTKIFKSMRITKLYDVIIGIFFIIWLIFLILISMI
jgi:hypothetical protein